MGEDVSGVLESQIERWRAYAAAHGGSEAHVADVEARLRNHALHLGNAGLDEQETFLVALRRVAQSDAVSSEFARAYSDDLLVSSAGEGLRDQDADSGPRSASAEIWVMLGCAIAAGLAVKLPSLLGYSMDGDGASFYMRNLSLLVLPFLAIYFIWKRGLSRRGTLGLAAVFVSGAVFANVYPFTPGGSTEVLTAIHLPIVMWLTLGSAYVGGDWRSDERRMEYVRFTGEWLINFALVGLGGGVLIALTAGVFGAIGVDIEPFMETWILSCAAGAVIVAAWLAGTPRNLIGGMAPMLARVFTPLFAVMLAALLVGVVQTRGIVDMDREVLILFDLLLVVVLALVLYAVSARDRLTEPALFDWIQLVLVACALAVDVFAVLTIAGRLSAYGFSANRTAALGLNLILLVNLAWSAVLQSGFLRSNRGFEAIERWHMRYLTVYAVWAAIVVIAFPPIFGFA